MTKLQTTFATAEVQAYGGDWAGDVARLLSYRTSRNGVPCSRYRWSTAYAGAHSISGCFVSIKAALARAGRDARVRNITTTEA